MVQVSLVDNAFDTEHDTGNLLIMPGETQQHCLHAIAKEKEICQPRINLTFRTIFPSFAG